MFEQIERLVSLLEKCINFIKLLKVDLELITGLLVVDYEFFVILSVFSVCLQHILCISMIDMPRRVYFDSLWPQHPIDFTHLYHFKTSNYTYFQ